jgi:hypothetical protein
MSDCGFTWGYHREHRCRLNDEHTPVYPNPPSSPEEVWLHLCWCGEAVQEVGEEVQREDQ